MDANVLYVWLYGTLLGELVPVGAGDRVTFRVAPDGLERWGEGSPVLSVHTRLTERGIGDDAATSFFAGLLPEGQQLARMARFAGVAERDTFGLLTHFGKDVAGAVYLTPEPGVPDVESGHYREMTDNEFAAAVSRTAYGERNGFEFEPLGNKAGDLGRSLTGYQGKLLVARFGGRWYLPERGAPSTHIAKPPSKHVDYPDLTQNEAATMRLANLVGLADTHPRLLTIAGQDIYVQSRYDRVVRRPFVVERLHQEDGCQATGHLPQQKYQRNGGPTLRDMAAVSPGQMTDFLAHVTFKLVIGDTDAHAKNYSWLHLPDGSVTLASMYDCQPGGHYVGNTLAQSVNGVETLPRLGFADLVAEGASWGLQPDLAEQVVADTVAAMATHYGSLDLSRVNPEAFRVVERRIAQFLSASGRGH